MSTTSTQIDVVATVFKSHKVHGPIADAMMKAACSKLDKLGTVKS